jgi:phosphate transport system ATP-binding protein
MTLQTHISVKSLTVRYGEHQVLHNISLDIPDKNITAIIGPSGCGKTTLLKSFNRLIELQDGITVTGQVLVDGENIYDPNVELIHLRKKMGLLFQKPQVLPMSVYENVAYGPRIHGVRNKKKLNEIVERYIQEAGLWNEVKDRLHIPASKLSVGQQQRLCLARGLAIEPEVILADEPTASLDPISAERIEQKFMELKSRYTIVLVTHILRQAKRLADYVVFLYLGKLVEHGPAANFFENPKNPITQAYISGRFIGDSGQT